MKDNEIIKALRCCADKGCKFCSEQGKPYCRETVASLAWDLICRQKEEIEELGKYKNDYYVLKSEARKEFAERFMIEAAKILEINTIYWMREIKNKLLAEMEERE